MASKQNEERPKIFSSAWKILAGVATVFVVIATQLVNFTFSLEKYSAAFSLYGKEFIFLFPIAILFFVLLAMSIGSIKSVHKAYYASDERKNKIYLIGLIISIGIILISTANTIYQGRKLILGNLIQYRLSHAKYLINAQKYFDEGDLNSALIELNTCVNTLNNDRCVNVRNALKKRFELRDNIIGLINNYAVDLDGKILILEDLSLISADNTLLRGFKDTIWKNYETVFALYEKSLMQIKSGNLTQAVNLLDRVDRLWTDFGHNRFLYKEIKRLNIGEVFNLNNFFLSDDYAAFRYPYLSALHRMGITNFAKHTAESSTLALRKLGEPESRANNLYYPH